MRKLIVLLAGLIILLAVNFSIYQREKLTSEGRVIFLELAPVDPRSLMQGDYMALRFKVANDVLSAGNMEQKSMDGHLVVTLDERGIGGFSRLADAATLAKNEALLRYRIRNNQVKLATNAFFFEEGSASKYQQARYGEFRVSADGEMLLTNLRDVNLTVLGGTH